MAVITTNVDEGRRLWTEEVFADIDSKNIDGFVGRVHPDAEMKFGNGEPLRGHDQIRAGNEGFLSSIATISHEITGLWEFDGTLIARLIVAYERLDGEVVELPSCTIIEESGGLISNYQVFFDVGPLGLGQ